jgi:hypothetical protein
MLEIELFRYFQMAALAFYVLMQFSWVLFVCLCIERCTLFRTLSAMFISMGFLGVAIYPVLYFFINSPLNINIQGVDRIYEGFCFSFTLYAFIFAFARLKNMLKIHRPRI